VDVAHHIDALETEGVRLVDAALAAGPVAPVPACPGWQVRDLLAHIGFVHRWATRYVATGLTTMVDEPDEEAILAAAPDDGSRPGWVAEGHAALVGALRSAPDDLVCWTFLAAPWPLAMWARRQAHETAVHRVDAQQAAGIAVTPVGADLAADGIEELLCCFYGRSGVPDGEPTGKIGLVPTDRPERWTVSTFAKGVSTARGLDDCDVTVRASANDLYLLLWNRVGAQAVVVEGPPGAFERLWASKGVTWQ
jgi:uncharacterized protein (TIGR03083 family)